MTVVALVSLVLGITLPRIDLERARVRSSANELVTVLVSAQSRAVLNQHDVAVSFDTTAATALVHLDADNDGSVGAGETTRLVQLGEGVRFGAGPAAGSAPGGGQAVTFSQTHAGLPAVVFHRNGSASQNGVVNLVAGSDVATTFDDRYVRSIEIARPTGRAVCYRLRDGSWEASC